MQLRCLGSSSSGNCYLLENETECLVLEVGLPLKEVKKALDFNVSKIVGVLVSHEHGDHFKYVKDYLKDGIPIMASQGTWSTLPYEVEISEKVMRSGYWYQLGNFTITPFRVVHDAVEPFGFIIRHPDIGALLFASDTEYIKQNFRSLKLNHIMIECNYSQEIIDERMNSGGTVKSLRDRVLQSHMELETCKEFIRTNATSALDTITLLHLSDGNSDTEQFKKEIQEIHPFAIVYVADKEVEVNLDIIPFM
jgi:phosphoribosyl 1,2-cyclic phosphodiesterase